MKIMLVCNASIKSGELKCASWIQSILINVKDTFEFIITSPDPLVKKIYKETARIEGYEFIIYRFNSKLAEEMIFKVMEIQSFDGIIVFGTEYYSAYAALKASEMAGMIDYTAVFAQGFCSACAKHYAEGIPEKVIKQYTIRDLLRHDRIVDQIKSLKKRSVVEGKVLSLTNNFIGRTTMDLALFRLKNSEAIYFKCNDILRDSFYKNRWKYSECNKHRIFVSQYYYPLKGFHYLLEAAHMLKNKFPDLVIAAAGYSPILADLKHNEIKDSSYIRYIKKLARKYDLVDSIQLLGNLCEDQMVEQYLKCNVFVMPSTIENSPNSLAEAMILGVPSVVSDVGGVTDFAEHQKEAYIYPSSATYLLAYYIEKVFLDKENAEKIGTKGRNRALLEYDREKNSERLREILNYITDKR